MTLHGWARVLLLGVGGLLLIAPGRAQAAATFTLSDSEIIIDSSTGDGRSSLLLKADGQDTGPGHAIEALKDLQSPLPPPLQINMQPYELPGTDNSRRWVLLVDIRGLPRNATQKRYLSFTFAGQQITLPYTLTNRSTATFAWSVKPPVSELNLTAGEPVKIGIAVQAVPATGVRVMQVTLVEQSRKTPLGNDIVLCKQPTGPCESNLDANSANPMWLRTSAAPSIVGKYAGTVIIGADQKPDGETLNLTLYGTTLYHQLLGVLVILIGVVGAWITTTWTQNRLNRAQALLPARLMAERVATLRRQMAAPPNGIDAADTVHTRKALDDLNEQLEEKWLGKQGYLPPPFPLPFKGPDPKIDDYKQFLAQSGARIALLGLIVEEGFVAVWRKIPAALSDAAKKAIDKACHALDLKGAETPPPASNDAIASIQATLATLDTDLAAGTTRTTNLSAAAIPSPTFQQLSIEIRDLSTVTWLVFGALATCVGTYILIISNLGFGVPSDYFICLFWGFGLPVGSQQLVQSTVGSVGTALGVSVPRAS
jgi:hypothetical protein